MANYEENECVQVVGNDIYYYCDISQQNVLEATMALKQLEKESLTMQVHYGVSYPINLHINSNGGDVFAGFAFANVIEQIKIPVVAMAEGICASAATLPFLAASQRSATANTQFLIHQITTGFWGTHQALRDETKLIDELMKQLVDFYNAKTKLTKKEIKEMMKRDTWINAEKAHTLGITNV